MKTLLSLVILLFSTTFAHASILNIYDNNGLQIGEPDTTIIDIRDFDTGIWTLSSSLPFFGSTWVAHDGLLFDNPGYYQFDTGNGNYEINLAAGYTLGYILIDWGFSQDIDLVNIWDSAGNSIDIDGDGIAGIAMIDGPFTDKSINISRVASSLEINPAITTVPVPEAVWLFGTGLIGLASVARRKGRYVSCS